MKSARFFLSLLTLATAGCATSLAPSEDFNDWTNAAIYRHYQEPRGSATATAAVRSSLAKAPSPEGVRP